MIKTAPREALRTLPKTVAKYRKLFRQAGFIDDRALATLTDLDLESLGVRSRKHQAALEKHFARSLEQWLRSVGADAQPITLVITMRRPTT